MLHKHRSASEQSVMLNDFINNQLAQTNLANSNFESKIISAGPMMAIKKSESVRENKAHPRRREALRYCLHSPRVERAGLSN